MAQEDGPRWLSIISHPTCNYGMIAKYIYNSNEVNQGRLKKYRIRKSQCSLSRIGSRLEKALPAVS